MVHFKEHTHMHTHTYMHAYMDACLHARRQAGTPGTHAGMIAKCPHSYEKKL